MISEDEIKEAELRRLFDELLRLTYVVEYSRLSERRGLYPLHWTTADKQHDPGPLEWKEVFRGSAKDALEVLKLLDKKYRARLHTKEQRKVMSPSKRYSILKRDGFKCVLCGRGAASGIVLHVDHIVPVSAGGLTEDGNLRALCEDCNVGKGVS